MKRLAKAVVLSMAVFVTVAAPVTGARARSHHHGHRRSHYHHHRSRGGNAAAGVIGLAAGAIIGSAITQSQRPRVIYAPSAYHSPAPYRAYRYSEPWSQRWYSYCSRKFRSFNPRTETYRGYNGRDYSCNAP